MKRKLFIIISILLTFRSFTQNILDSIHPLFKGKRTLGEIGKLFEHYEGPKTSSTRIILGLFHSNKLFNSNGLYPPTIPNEEKEFINEVKLDSVYKTPDSKLSSRSVITLYDSMGIIATASGINHTNAHEYEFRVLKNRKKEIVPWRSIKFFYEPYTFHSNPDGSEQTEDAYLGEFRTTFGNSLTVEVRKRNDTLDLYSVSAIWINRFPKVIATFSNTEMPAFLSVFKQQWKNDFTHGISTYYGDTRTVPVDSLLITRKEFKSNENSIIFYLNDKIKSKELIEYRLLTGKNSSKWKPNDFDMNLIWLKELKPGTYILQIRYSVQRHNISEYNFTIHAAWYQTLIFKIALVILGLSSLGFILLIFKSRKQKQRMRIEQLQKQQIQTELKSIRSQFNPHFVFNALNSIQGLITKNDMDRANKYLIEFSTLLRESLRESSREMVNLSSEIKLLDSYLKLEQLRFGFTYTFDVESGINTDSIEVPALIFQPLAENAVKHGIASLYEKGKLIIDFKKSSSDIIATIVDNGRGFDTAKDISGYGLKLTKERISLLNMTLKEQQIKLIINGSTNGTTVSLVFKNWLI
jgi:two-component sensor histidine kinase